MTEKITLNLIASTYPSNYDNYSDNDNDTKILSEDEEQTFMDILNEYSYVPLSVIIFVMIISNLFVIFALFTHHSLKQPHNYLIASLAFSDLSLGIFVLPIDVVYGIKGYWFFNHIICRLWRTADVTICTASILSILAIAYDRYSLVSNPAAYIQKRTTKRICFIIGIVWGISIIISILPLLWLENFGLVENKCELCDDIYFIIISAFVTFYIPMIAILYLYYKIYKSLKTRNDNRRSLLNFPQNLSSPPLAKDAKRFTFFRQVEDEESLDCSFSMDKIPNQENIIQNVAETKQKFYMKKERRAIFTLGVVIITFIICWFPFFVIYTFQLGKENIFLSRFIIWLGYMNSFLNPFIYAASNSDFKKAFISIIHKMLNAIRNQFEKNEQILKD